jgi:Plasmid pRiA4b ORF-3-like protein
VTDLEAAAGKAPLTGQIRSFLGWLGEGRKLTQTGRIGLADARYLVEILGTGDQIDPEIGGRVFKTKSSEELPYLTRIVEWAKAARLVRAIGTKLVPVKKNAALVDRPLDLVLAMLAAYPKLGKPLFPRNTWRDSLVGDEFREISQQLLTVLLASPGPCPLAALNDTAYDAIAARYVLSDLTGQQHDSLRRMITVDVTIAMSALHVLGVVVLDRGADHDPAEDNAELTALGRYAIRRLRGMAQAGDPLLQVRITLTDVDDPPVWRRVLIPAAYSLDRVHAVIQAAMGWQNYHMHAFRLGDVSYGRPDPDDVLGFLDETGVRLGDLAATADRIEYEYDFGDSWEHELVIEARTTAQDGSIYPACLAGEGACPPEDCGGSYGFEEFKAIITGPPSTERDEMLQWAGGDYDPARFNLTAANTAVAAVLQPRLCGGVTGVQLSPWCRTCPLRKTTSSAPLVRRRTRAGSVTLIRSRIWRSTARGSRRLCSAMTRTEFG